MKSIRHLVKFPLFAAALAAAFSLAPREALATSECRGGCRFADNIQLTVSNKPLCTRISTNADECSCMSRIIVDNGCDEPIEPQDFTFGSCTDCSPLTRWNQGSILLPIEQSSKEQTGEATFTAHQGDETITIKVTYDITGTFVPSPPPASPSGCTASGGLVSTPSWLLAGAGALALAITRRRSKRARAAHSPGRPDGT